MCVTLSTKFAISSVNRYSLFILIPVMGQAIVELISTCVTPVRQRYCKFYVSEICIITHKYKAGRIFNFALMIGS